MRKIVVVALVVVAVIAVLMLRGRDERPASTPLETEVPEADGKPAAPPPAAAPEIAAAPAEPDPPDEDNQADPLQVEIAPVSVSTNRVPVSMLVVGFVSVDSPTRVRAPSLEIAITSPHSSRP